MTTDSALQSFVTDLFTRLPWYSDRLEELKDWFAGLGYRFLGTVAIDYYFTNMPEF
jgi:hypothetical protein